MSSSWKRLRGWTEAHGWGTTPILRRIGRERRERTRRLQPLPECLAPALQEAREAVDRAWAEYEAAELHRDDFEAVRARYDAALARVEQIEAEI